MLQSWENLQIFFLYIFSWTEIGLEQMFVLGSFCFSTLSSEITQRAVPLLDAKQIIPILWGKSDWNLGLPRLLKISLEVGIWLEMKGFFLNCQLGKL